MAWLPDGEKNEDMFIHFDTIHERDRQTHTHRHRMTAKAALEKKTVTSIVKKLVISWQWLWDYR